MVRMGPPAWVADAVFYQVFPDRYARSPRVPAPGPFEAWDAPPTVHGFKGGNLPGLTERLDELANLGITALYLNPVFASASNHRYHTYDYLRVDPLLGGDAALRELLDAAHARGMRVILDGVFNHAGRGFWPFHHVLETGRHSPYVDWFHLDAARLAEGRQLAAYPQPTLATALDPTWGDRHRPGRRSLAALGYRAWWDLPALPKLNVENPQVRSYLLDVAEHWTRFGADGWRFDVPEEIALDFWHAVRERVRSVNPDAYLTGEIWHPAPRWVAPDGPFDGLMNYPLAWTIIGFAAGEHLDRAVASEQAEMRAQLHWLSGAEFLAGLDRNVSGYSTDPSPVHLNLLGSHDTPRLRTVCGADATAARLAFLLLMTLPGAPVVYYGDEVGMGGHADPGCRAGYPWDSPDRDDEMRAFVRAAIAMRRECPALRGPHVEALASDGSACAFRRGAGAGAVWVAMNAGDRSATLALPLPASGDEVLLSVGPAARIGRGDADRTVRLGPRSAVVVRG